MTQHDAMLATAAVFALLSISAAIRDKGGGAWSFIAAINVVIHSLNYLLGDKQ
jgi:hypothetical protein